MVLLFLAELTVRATWWTVKGVYHVGRYIIYGKEKTDQEKIIDLEQQLKEIQESLHKSEGLDQNEQTNGTRNETVQLDENTQS
jgi:hypothetical protein